MGQTDARTGDASISPGDASTTDPCAGISCEAPPGPACSSGTTLRTFSAPGTCADGQCSYDAQDTPCPLGCANGACIDACAGVVCASPPPPSCVGDHLRTFASTGTCSAGTCAYASSDAACGLGCFASTCFNPDPALDDPARVSRPFECQGDPLTVPQIIDHVTQGDDTILIQNNTNLFGTMFVLRVTRVQRRCHPLTGCTDWQGSSLYNEYTLRLTVTGTGQLQLIQDDAVGARSVVEATLSSGELQDAFDKPNPFTHIGEAQQYKLRITHPPGDVRACFSAAGISGSDPPTADGSHLEWFWLGKTVFFGPFLRVTPDPLPPWENECQGTPAGNALIGSWFPPGSTKLVNSSTTNSMRDSSQSCHPITGCAPWAIQTPSQFSLFGLQALPSTFALWLDRDVLIPFAHGVINATVGSNTYTGLVTTEKCISYDRVTVTSPPGSAIAVTRHLQEHNTLP